MKPSICFAVSTPFTLNAFLLGHINALSQRYAVTVLMNLRDDAIPPRLPAGIEQIHVRIPRKISILYDISALWKLWRLMRQRKFACIHSVSPKAGLLTMLAGRLAGVPLRLHTFTGQVWANRKGPMRTLLMSMDRLLAACATHTFADSASQREFLIGQGIAAPGQISVLAEGSISGVDTQRFKPDADARKSVRDALGIAAAAPLLLYVGRMKRDKGVPDLLAAFALLLQDVPETRLLLVGPDEDGLLGHLDNPHIYTVGYATDVERYMAAADLLCLPSYREGFGSVIIEAAACGIPAVASRIYGVTDAVVDGVTGLLHPPGDIAALRSALLSLLGDPASLSRMAKAARARAIDAFDSNRVTAAWVDYYHRHIAE